MSKTKKTNADDNLEIVEGALSRSEQFIEQNSKKLTIILAALIAVVAIYFAYSKFYIAPQQEKAVSEMFFAEQYFEVDSFNLALNGDGNHFGFLYIIDEYGSTKAANLAHYYAGFSYLHLGQFAEAEKHLSKFSKKDPLLGSLAYGGLGDANLELGKKSDAISNYMKAAKEENEFTTPMFLFKAAMVHESDGKYADALKLYERIDADYKLSAEGRNISKYIERAKLNL